MVKKLLSILKTTILLWICILIPLLIGMKIIEMRAEKDAKSCLDTFIQTECVGLAKNVALQFAATYVEMRNLADELQINSLEGEGTSHAFLQDLLKKNSNLLSINIYRADGRFFASSGKITLADLSADEIPQFITDEFEKRKKSKAGAKNSAGSNTTKSDNSKTDTADSEEDDNDEILSKEISYSIDQLEDTKEIVLKFYVPLRLEILDEESNGKIENFIMEMTMKWARYEQYMNELMQGSFPRMFYIISPDCKRYVSLNSFPDGAKTKKAVVALGMHLTSRIKNIASGFSDQNIEGLRFRLYKDDIKMPSNMKGNSFYMIVAVDDMALIELIESLISGTSVVLIVLVLLLLLISIVMAKFYNDTKDQQEISETITEATPLAVIIFKASDGKIFQINLSAKTAFRIGAEDVNTVNMWNIFITDEDRGYILNAVNSKIQALNCEVLVQSFGGASFWAICSASPIEIKGERYVVLAVLDINRRKEIEKKLANNAEVLEQQIAERTADLEVKARELKESNAALEKARLTADRANDAKSKFLTSMSNELKTPLNAIIGYAEILQEEALDRKDTVSSDDLGRIIGAAKHLLSLIDEILDVSKIEEGKTQLFFENIEISSIIKDVEGVTMPLVANNNNSLFLEYPKDIGVMYTDGTKVRQCLLNLLGNAAKFTEFGKVTLRVSPIVKNGKDFIEFAVIDNGVGIAPERIDTIWEAFKGGKAGDGGGGSGAGLGLSITKKYAEYLGGEVAVESEVGVGSKFMIRLPRVSEVVSNEFIEVKNQVSEKEEEKLAKELEEEFVAANEGGSNDYGSSEYSMSANSSPDGSSG